MREIDLHIFYLFCPDGKRNKFLYLGLLFERLDEELHVTLVFFYLLDILFDLRLCLAGWYSFDIVQEKVLVELRDAVVSPSVDEL